MGHRFLLFPPPDVVSCPCQAWTELEAGSDPVATGQSCPLSFMELPRLRLKLVPRLDEQGTARLYTTLAPCADQSLFQDAYISLVCRAWPNSLFISFAHPGLCLRYCEDHAGLYVADSVPTEVRLPIICPSFLLHLFLTFTSFLRHLVDATPSSPSSPPSPFPHHFLFSIFNVIYRRHLSACERNGHTFLP